MFSPMRRWGYGTEGGVPAEGATKVVRLAQRRGLFPFRDMPTECLPIYNELMIAAVRIFTKAPQ